MNRKFKTLTTSAEEVGTAFKIILSTEIVAYLSEKCSVSSSLRRAFVDLFLEEFVGSPDQKNNNLGILLCYDHLLWKSVRLNFNEILNSCNAIDQESKKEIGKQHPFQLF